MEEKQRNEIMEKRHISSLKFFYITCTALLRKISFSEKFAEQFAEQFHVIILSGFKKLQVISLKAYYG